MNNVETDHVGNAKIITLLIRTNNFVLCTKNIGVPSTIAYRECTLDNIDLEQRHDNMHKPIAKFCQSTPLQSYTADLNFRHHL